MATRDDGKTSPFMDDPDLQKNIDSEKKENHHQRFSTQPQHESTTASR
jgi:hypothetical protein